MSKQSKFNHQNVFTAFTVVLTVFFLFEAGFTASKHWYASMVSNFILSAFFSAMLALTIRERMSDHEYEVRRELAEDAKSKLDEIFAEATKLAVDGIDSAAPRRPFGKEDDHEAELQRTLAQILGEVVIDGNPPTPEQIKVVQHEFQRRTDHQVELKFELGGMRVHIHNGHDATTGLVPGGAAAKRTQIAVKDLDEVTARRSAAGKKAAATRKARQEAAVAATVKEARRAKRAAQRAAKQK